MTTTHPDADVRIGPAMVTRKHPPETSARKGILRLHEGRSGVVLPKPRPDPRNEIVQHLPALRAFAVSMTRNSAAADDLVQDTVVKAWTNFARFEPGSSLRAWLFTILRNTFYSNRRKGRREVEDVDGLMAAGQSEMPRHDGVLALSDFLKAFRQLPAEQREALVLVGASGFSYEEAGEMCGVPGGTIKSRVSRARARLLHLLDPLPGLGTTDEAKVAALRTENRQLPSAA